MQNLLDISTRPYKKTPLVLMDDYLGRMQKITDSDGEVVSYIYDKGGRKKAPQ